MNCSLRQILLNGIQVISNPFMIVVVVALMLFGGWWSMEEITPILWILAGVYFLLALIGGQLVKCGTK